jgi:hypothetical protein
VEKPEGKRPLERCGCRWDDEEEEEEEEEDDDDDDDDNSSNNNNNNNNNTIAYVEKQEMLATRGIQS